MTGAAVFLYRKKHEGAYVVGVMANVSLAFSNEDVNMRTLCKPTAVEMDGYNRKRETVGGKKLITSTLTSVQS